MLIPLATSRLLLTIPPKSAEASFWTAEEIDLAQTNYDEGFTTYQNLDRQLRNETLHISNLTQERDDLINQIPDDTEYNKKKNKDFLMI